MPAHQESEQLAAALRALKNRSGLSYEALAKRTEIAGSTLHRYCKGTSVPQDYGSVHRLGTVCGASPDELRSLHRLWALADTARLKEIAESSTEASAESSAEGSAETSGEASAGSGDAVTDPVAGKPATPAPAPVRRARYSVVAAAVAAVVTLGGSAWFLSAQEAASASHDDRVLFSSGCRSVVAMGEHDNCVHEVQQLLHDKGADIGVDSDFGPQTLRRVTAFQVFAGLPPNGIVDDATKEALYASPKVRMNVWSPEKVRQRIRAVFKEAPAKAVAIADCQSFLDPLHILPNTNGTRNWGVFQISDARLRELGGTPRQALDPAWNITAAKRLWDRNHDFHDWPNCERAAGGGTASPTPSP
ncbi:helix-turn-helix domain-containing protein [Streptomyces sp. WI04-05B]|uniref:helix-turn-helix domain-containing protein n=1 Tax=Streptomyces TaxID=1883 RepID=UPI0029B70E91|nr:MULTISPECIES: helix-turn-helix domain-containing protein [unclassified Streptomyces]MDX2543949.1 helix-turn-helix domain-containing protein [Streptomyces sp. WI04-05B]MDX2584341.1 helix-turn-helix domain-containing protein [Streptomyces sp. WI04-05A]